MRNLGGRQFLAILAAVAIVALLGFGLIARSEDRVAVGEPFPDTAVDRLGGTGTISVADFEGKWVLVNLWASWCKPCLEEVPALEKFSREHRDDLVVLGIATQDLTGDALDFVENLEVDGKPLEVTYPLGHDGEGERKSTLGATGLPESFLVDPQGNLALEIVGAVDDAYLNQHVAPLIEGSSGA